MPSRAITEDNLGAWLIKCDPETKFDLPAAIEAGLESITEWSVVPGYRSEMMTRNDKVILWVSGNGQRMTRGIWGVGRIVAPVEPAADDEYFADPGYWLDLDAMKAVELFAPVDIPLFGEAISAEQIAAAGITDLEVQRFAHGSNPSWVSKDQLARLEELLPAWPGDVPNEEQITVSDSGARFGSAGSNAVVEAIAMAEVIAFYGSDWRSTDVSADKVGWDITFTHNKTREVLKVEVKGVSGPKPKILLTANEVRAAEQEGNWVLAVVTHVLSSPKVHEYASEEALAAAKPYVFKADLS